MTRLEAETVLFTPATVLNWQTATAETYTAHTPERRRIDATNCPKCGGWVTVKLRPVRLRCVRCGLEARP